MKLSSETYEIVKAGRDNLAEGIQRIDRGAVYDVTDDEIAMLRRKLRSIDAIIREYRKRQLH